MVKGTGYSVSSGASHAALFLLFVFCFLLMQKTWAASLTQKVDQESIRE